MPLGRIDFVNIPTFEPVDGGQYDGFTESWEAKPSNNGDSTNIEATFKFNYLDGDGNEAQRTIKKWWNLKKEALWSLRQDLVNMGVDPSEFGEDVDLESLLNQVFSVPPTPVTLTITKAPYTPRGGGETQIRNNVTGVTLRSV
jgi:hypothetical protein